MRVGGEEEHSGGENLCRISRWAPGIFVEQKISKPSEERMASRMVGVRHVRFFWFFFFSLGVDENPRLSIDTTLHCTDTEFSYTRDESRGKPTATIGERVRPALSLPPDSLSLDPEVIPTEMLWIPGSWGD